MPSDWNQAYLEGFTPWDSNLPSRELAAVLDAYGIRPGRALELGCGTGTNSLLLAERGFEVTAIDLAPAAIEQARRRAKQAGAAIDFHVADLTQWEVPPESFDLVFDRGCYHCVRRDNLAGYQQLVRRALRPGGRLLCLCGNPADTSDAHIPKVASYELRAELGRWFRVEHLRPFYFEDADHATGPLGWSAWLARRADPPELPAEAPVFERLTSWLERLSIPFEVLRHAPVYTSAEAAAIRNAPLASGAKALVCKADERFVMVVLPADRRLANKALRGTYGWRSLRFATSDELLALTQLAPGAVPPFGSLFGLPVLCDRRLAEVETINFNAGDHAISLRMRFADYLAAEQPELGSHAE